MTSKQCHSSEIAELLVSQVVSKVRWREIVENMIKDRSVIYSEANIKIECENLSKKDITDIILKAYEN